MKKIIFTILLSVLFIANVNAAELLKSAETETPFNIDFPEEAKFNDNKKSEINLMIPKLYAEDIIIPESACDSKGEESEFIICKITKESAKEKFEGIKVKRAYDSYRYTIKWYEDSSIPTTQTFTLNVKESNTELKTAKPIEYEGSVGGNITLKDERITKTEGGHGYFRYHIYDEIEPSRKYDYEDKINNMYILSMKDDVTATFTFKYVGTYNIESFYTVPGENGNKVTYQTSYIVKITDPNYNGSGEYVIEKDNKTINVSVGEQFSLKRHEKANSMYIGVHFDQELVDKKIINIENIECSTWEGISSCYIEKDKWDIAISQEGVYKILVYSFKEPKNDDNWIWTDYETTYNIIVTKPVEVKKEDTKVLVDNKKVLESTKDNQVVTDIKVADDSKVEVIEVKKEIFATAKEKNIDLVYEIKNANNKLAYSWTFDAKRLENKHESEMNLMLKTGEINKDMAKKFNPKNAYSIQFAYHGILPGTAKVKIYVGDKYEPKSVLDLYYNNQEQNKIESVVKKLTVDDEGYVTIEINHCSEYILTRTDEKILDEEPKSGDIVKLNYITMLIGAIGLGVMIKKRV